ncbi:type II toxin-antitoxin system HipA family toxin, partial [Candidatus Fermentibacteria bacterium]
FSRSGIQISPLEMPLSNQLYSFPELSQKSFHGLPGLLSDSLPDRFGNALINRWLARNGRTPDSFNAVERLCYTGNRGMGALEFVPITGPKPSKKKTLCVDELVRLASEILTNRESLNSNFSDEALADILRVGTSAGGARAKAVIAWNPVTNQVRSGKIKAGDGFQYWLLKFDGIDNNGDKGLNDPKGYGIIEYAYSQMAKSCGIEMSECRLFREKGRSHFMTKRFDRLPGGNKLHMQSLAALAHFDFNLSGAYSYEQVFQIMRKLNLPYSSIEQQFKRMVFNIVARNQDDHVKNIAFLMNRQGQWSLAPAFDVNYSYQPDGTWTARHQMTVNGKQEAFTSTDLKECAKTAGMKQGQWRIILEQVQSVVSKWEDFADEAGVADQHKQLIQKTLSEDTL